MGGARGETLSLFHLTVPPLNQEPKSPGFPPPSPRGREQPWLGLSLPFISVLQPLGIRPCLKPCIAPLSPCVCGWGNGGEASQGLDVLVLSNPSQCPLHKKGSAVAPL